MESTKIYSEEELMKTLTKHGLKKAEIEKRIKENIDRMNGLITRKTALWVIVKQEGLFTEKEIQNKKPIDIESVYFIKGIAKDNEIGKTFYINFKNVKVLKVIENEKINSQTNQPFNQIKIVLSTGETYKNFQDEDIPISINLICYDSKRVEKINKGDTISFINLGLNIAKFKNKDETLIKYAKLFLTKNTEIKHV